MDLRIGERDAGATRAAIPSPPLPTALRFFSVGFGGNVSAQWVSTTGFRVRHEDIRRRRARDKRSYCYGLTIIRASAIKICPFEEICLRRGKLSFEITLPLSLSLSL